MGRAIETMKRAIVAMLALVLGVCAAAADGRIPIGTAPYTITAPGSYYLTADLAASGGNVITISSSAVNLDLNGHYILQASAASGTTCIYCNGYSDIRIANGTLIGSDVAVRLVYLGVGLAAVDHITVRGANSGMWIWGNGGPSSSAWPYVQVTNNAVGLTSGSNGVCIAVQAVQGGRVASNILVGGGLSSSSVGINSYGNGLIIEDNTITYSTFGIELNNDAGARILRNSVSFNWNGIYCGNSRQEEISENNVSSNAVGITFSSVSGCVYRNNLAQGNTSTNYSIPGSGVTNGGGNY